MSVPPNILWIVTTQWRAQACGYAGDPNARTPCCDALAAAGTNFAQAVTPHPFGPFARAAMLTGVPSPANGVREYFDPLPEGSRTIAHDLRERGYATAWFGKWHLGKRDPDAPLVGEEHARIVVPPEARGGFEFWEGFESGFLLNDPWLHGTRLAEPRKYPGYQPDVLANAVESWRTSNAGDRRPWFCVVSMENPHPPYNAAPADRAAPDPTGLALAANVPRGAATEERARRELAGYYAHISATDRAIGRLVAALSPETIVVLTSVHGDMHGAHGLFRKGWPQEESVRVPFVVRRAAGETGRDESPVSLVDLPEMTRSWADGRIGTCRRSFAEISMPSVVRLPLQCDRVWHGRRSRDAKVVWGEDGAPWLVFDLRNDPGEERNLVSSPAGARIIAQLTGS